MRLLAAVALGGFTFPPSHAPPVLLLLLLPVLTPRAGFEAYADDEVRVFMDGKEVSCYYPLSLAAMITRSVKTARRSPQPQNCCEWTVC